MLDLEDTHVMQLIIRGPARITSVKILLAISKETLMSFGCISSKGEISLSLNRAKIALLRSLKAYIWYLNMTS